MTNTQDTKLIPLTQGKFAIVDANDYEWLSKFNWFASIEKNGTAYAFRQKSIGNGKQLKISMHRLIMKEPKTTQVDHRNNNGLDNRRSNLRLCTPAQNARNRKVFTGTSKYKGVSKKRGGKKWISQIKSGSKTTHLGSFDKEEDAAKAYNNKAIELFGEFAWLNDC